MNRVLVNSNFPLDFESLNLNFSHNFKNSNQNSNFPREIQSDILTLFHMGGGGEGGGGIPPTKVLGRHNFCSQSSSNIKLAKFS